MPYRIIRPCIVPGVKPFELIVALMLKEGISNVPGKGAAPLSKRMNKPKLQPQIHRFINGQVASPDNTTAAPLAKYFDIPLEAIYDEKVATEVAKMKDVRLAAPPDAEDGKPKKQPVDRAAGLSDDALEQAAIYDKLDPAGQQIFRLSLFTARGGAHPPAKVAGRAEKPFDPTATGSSGLGELEDKKPKPNKK